MKKVFVSMLFLMIAVVGFSKTQSSISVISGSIDVLNQVGKTAVDSFDYSSTTIEGKPAIEYLKSHANGEYLRDWPNDNIVTEAYFFKTWNSEMKNTGVALVRSVTSDYKIIVHIATLDLGNTAAALLSISNKHGGAIISGTIDVIDNQSGNIVCKLKIDNMKGKGFKTFDVSTSDNRRRGLAYEKLAKQVIALAKNK